MKAKFHAMWLLLFAREWLLYTNSKIIGDVPDNATGIIAEQAKVLRRVK